MEWLNAAGYVHYEISNFALPGKEAVHNGNYWRAEPYLGVGPSAHSFNGVARQWNRANNAAYMKAVSVLENNGFTEEWASALYEEELLSEVDQYNEYILTGLRTSWGVDADRLKEPYRQYFLDKIYNYIGDFIEEKEKAVYSLTPKGRLLADRISSDLFY